MDGVLDKLTPDDIENIILPTLKKDREKILEQKYWHYFYYLFLWVLGFFLELKF